MKHLQFQVHTAGIRLKTPQNSAQTPFPSCSADPPRIAIAMTSISYPFAILALALPSLEIRKSPAKPPHNPLRVKPVP